MRHHDEYPWLQSLLTVERFKRLWAATMQTKESKERSFLSFLLFICESLHSFEIQNPNKIRRSHIIDFLDGGIASSSRIDGLGEGVGEFLRSKHVEIPLMFLNCGRI